MWESLVSSAMTSAISLAKRALNSSIRELDLVVAGQIGLKDQPVALAVLGHEAEIGPHGLADTELVVRGGGQGGLEELGQGVQVVVKQREVELALCRGKCWYSTGLLTWAVSAISSMAAPWKPRLTKTSCAARISCRRRSSRGSRVDLPAG